MKYPVILFFLCLALVSRAQEKVIRLYSGTAPGSENWNWKEQTSDSNLFQTRLVYNVVEPTLTVFPATGPIQTGTAVVIAPGGGLLMLSINSEGNDVAEWLSKKGVTAFVLKYRVAHTNDPIRDGMALMGDPKKLDSVIKPITPLAMNDALTAISYVRKNAETYHINPNRIGLMGFSAGGGVTMSVAYNGSGDSRPDFIAPIYAWDKDILGSVVPTEKMPAFIVVATDDQIGLAPVSIDIYNKWIAAKQSAELIIYQNGGHGFGMRKQNKLSDTWINRFEEWLGGNGLLWPEKRTGYLKDVTYEMYLKYQKDQEEQQRLDWANRRKYAGENAKLAPPKSGEQRVVFMGNSITEGWKAADSAFFSDHPYIDRGISGQTTSQMLLRFREDVIDLKPKVVVILAGINDIAQNTGPIILESIYGNIVSMAELAKASGIKVVLSSVLPANILPWKKEIEPAEKVVKLNSMIKTYATSNKIVYLDYYTPMVDSKMGLKEEYTHDGVHPTLAGYKVMEPLAEKAIIEALKKK